MAFDQPEHPRAARRCGRCQAPLGGQDGYQHCDELLCADCCMELRLPLTRKTHWQYLGAVKTGYLRKPGEG